MKWQVTTEEGGGKTDLGIYEAPDKDSVIKQVLRKYPNYSDWTYSEQLGHISEVK